KKDNAQQIERMRATVDEKLQGTLEKRLGESFKLVSERLEKVHQGLGAMQQLASDVGGVQRVLTNVKARGGWGEVQLGALLEQLLTSEQFDRNVQTRDESGERVDYAIKLPGEGNGAAVWLPIDAKFPMEDYQRLITAQESGNSVLTDAAMKDLETQLRKSAKDIWVKYKLDQAASDMDKVAVRSRAITKKLRDVEELPSNPQPLLPELLRGEEEEEDVSS